jgi:hypothetical protein
LLNSTVTKLLSGNVAGDPKRVKSSILWRALLDSLVPGTLPLTGNIGAPTQNRRDAGSKITQVKLASFVLDKNEKA